MARHWRGRPAALAALPTRGHHQRPAASCPYRSNPCHGQQRLSLNDWRDEGITALGPDGLADLAPEALEDGQVKAMDSAAAVRALAKLRCARQRAEIIGRRRRPRLRRPRARLPARRPAEDSSLGKEEDGNCRKPEASVTADLSDKRREHAIAWLRRQRLEDMDLSYEARLTAALDLLLADDTGFVAETRLKEAFAKPGLIQTVRHLLRAAANDSE